MLHGGLPGRGDLVSRKEGRRTQVQLWVLKYWLLLKTDHPSFPSLSKEGIIRAVDR